MNRPSETRIDTGFLENLAVPASATKQAASADKKGLAAFSSVQLGQEWDKNLLITLQIYPISKQIENTRLSDNLCHQNAKEQANNNK